MTTAYERLKTARNNARPTGRAYINALFSDRLDLCGDRRFGEDPAIQAGIGTLQGRPVTYIAIDKGIDLESRMSNHFGCPMPEGYRKALRLMKQAEKFHRPVICFVDTLGRGARTGRGDCGKHSGNDGPAHAGDLRGHR